MIRLQKALADRGVASRRRAEELIAGGRVRVDGEAVMTLGTKVRPDARIDVDGVLTREATLRYVLLNKPKGVVSTANDERGRKTVVDLIGARERLYPVGRLDTDSEGALLLTNDGDWAERVLHPRYGHEREYDVTVSGDLLPETIAQLRNGIRLEEGLAVAARIDVQSRSRGASRLRMVLHTGWRRQIRRMLSVVGLRTVRLVRVRVGNLQLGKLREGEWRELTPKEIADLVRPAETARKPGRRAAARIAATAKPAVSAASSVAPPSLAALASAPRPRSRRPSVLPRSRSAVRAEPRRLGATGTQGAGVPRREANASGRPAPRSRPLSGAPRATSLSAQARPAALGRAPQSASSRGAQSARPASSSSARPRGSSTVPPRRPAPPGRLATAGRRPPSEDRAPTRRLPSLTRPVVRRGAPAGPRRAPARGPQRFGRRPPPKYGTSRGPVRARTTPR